MEKIEDVVAYSLCLKFNILLFYKSTNHVVLVIKNSHDLLSDTKNKENSHSQNELKIDFMENTSSKNLMFLQ